MARRHRADGGDTLPDVDRSSDRATVVRDARDSGMGDPNVDFGTFTNRMDAARRTRNIVNRGGTKRGGRTPSEEHIRKEADLEGESYEHERAEYEEGARKRKKRKSGGACEGEKSPMRLDRPGRKRGGGEKWIAGAIKHPGALHRELHVPEGQKIPEAKLEKAEHSSNPTLRKRASLAKTLKGFHH